ncbi:HAD family hydrolase [Guptibacillus hwajinpoensis]|uniref:HAD family hydrolase n=1 Tax=Guptibacillus hwajinpoensis TaxID=208199 RepID=UPI001CFE4111|nr:HAD family hydrolase [Pseudalkalibacillus hwajinpoensis]WLR59074.1 HAD family hydrolase [Pseudalkalibacillus hwajinpoensis]
MLTNPKAIFLDMDGTILNHYNKVSEYTKQVIDELREKGIYVFIATGRASDEISELVPEGFQVDGIVSSNGMAGYVEGKAIFEHSLELDLVEKIIEKAREQKVYYELFPYGEDRIALKQDRPYMEEEITDPQPEGVGLNEWLSRKEAIKEAINWKAQIEGNKFSKFYFFARTKEQINQWKDELENIKQDIDFTTSISSEHNVEVMVANVNKATGIKEMLQHFGLSGVETLAIGDSNNDLPMFQFADYAVAMKNASDQIKEIVDDVTEFTCDDDGVYHYLKSIVVRDSIKNA